MLRTRIISIRRTTMRGFTLVELMVGLAIGLVLVAGLALMFANTSRSREEIGKSVQQIENGRYAIELLQDDIALAGFYGELPPDVTTSNVPDACAAALGPSPVGSGLGWNSDDKTVPVPIMGLLPADAEDLACLPDHRAGTPAFALRRLHVQTVAPSSITSASKTVYVQTSRCSSDSLSTPFKVSDNNGDFTLQTFKCDAKNEVRQYVSRIYYVAKCSECDLDGVDIPTLKMAELRATSSGLTMEIIPLAEGIEDMHVLYGFDTSGSGNADKFLVNLSGDVGAADNKWENVVAMRLYLMSRTLERSPGFDEAGKTYDMGRGVPVNSPNDQFKRRVYTTTVRLPNVAGKREVPALPASSPSSSP